ncbi:predicted protein [Paecilomyces variotii No. 5]|uniref:Riboflavin aldehyde-forming enzyme n=1 Tax=Byssochlamys spectabilis (strain No. 5 / NBRC 109023) TaxID=1356009 RepID=V5HW02_BYSSN|nr:predicted protein [Paecilomyces variotii No. 5]
MEQNQSRQHPLASVPRRKPVGAAAPQVSRAPATPPAPVVSPDDTGELSHTYRDYGEKATPKWVALSEVTVFKKTVKLPFANNRRKRLLLLGGIGAVILLALIIGLAVGLTVGKNGVSNLPLPTNHGGPYTGDLTYYDPALGSCGITSSGSDSICAVSHLVFDAASTGSDPNQNPLCGMKIRLRRDGKSVDVKVVDRCVGCKATDIDTTRSVFSKLANLEQGRVTVEWAWLENAPVNVTA